MTNTLVRIYDKLSHAQNAHTELLRAGFDAARLRLDVRDEEAVPVQGNFYVGDPEDAGRDTQASRSIGGFLKSLIDSDKDDYEGTFRHDAQSATYILMIDATNDQEIAAACEITARHGALPTDNGTCGSTL
jgi:hypothetical protein